MPFSRDRKLGNLCIRHRCRRVVIGWSFSGFQHPVVVSRFHFLFYGSSSVSESDIYVCKLFFSTPGLRFGHDVKVIGIRVMACNRFLACSTAVLLDCFSRGCSLFSPGGALPLGFDCEHGYGQGGWVFAVFPLKVFVNEKCSSLFPRGVVDLRAVQTG